MRLVACISIVLAALVGCSPDDVGRTYSASRSGATVFVNARLFLDAKSPLKSGQSLVIEGGEIVALGEDIAIPEDATVIDLDGMIVLPGLIDMHAHLYANVGLRMQSQFTAYPPLYLAGGVTTIFSPGEFEPELIGGLRARIEGGSLAGPDVLHAGPYFDNDPSAVLWVDRGGRPEVRHLEGSD